MIRVSAIVAAAVLTGIAGCGTSSTSPSGSASLVVSVVDEKTGGAILDPVYQVVLKLTGAGTYEQAVQNGQATFSSFPPGEYVLTTSSLFGYLQVDYLKFNIDGERTFKLMLKPIDDLGVQEVFVDGQGSIPKGGTISVPAAGITLRLRGKYTSPRSPWPVQNRVSAGLDANSVNFVSRSARTIVSVLSATDFEVTREQWMPCGLVFPNQVCYTSADYINLSLWAPAFESEQPLILAKHQDWPLKFVLGPGCCSW